VLFRSGSNYKCSISW